MGIEALMGIEITDRQKDVKIDHVRLEGIIAKTLKDSACTQSVSVALVSAEEMTTLNQTYKKRDGVTDVLAFPMGDEMLGDVVICPAKAAEEAAERSLDVMDEILLYAVHGTLHLLGYDDSEEKAEEMYAKEDEILEVYGKER